LETGEARYFVCKDVTFDETQMVMMGKDLDKGEEKIHVKVEPFTKG